MRVFITGATGFVGSAIVQELIGARHHVIGLARSDANAAALTAAGAEVHRGSLEDLDSLRRGAAAADGVIHTGFIHDFTNYGRSAEADRRAIETFGSVLAGTNKPLVVTTGTLLVAPGRVATEDDAPDSKFARVSEPTGLAFVSQGVRVSIMRLPASVHGDGDHGFVPVLIDIARTHGASAYIDDGANRWPGVHRLDAARLYRIALEQAPAGTKLHAVADEGVPTREIAEVIGRRLGLPVVSKTGDAVVAHFGWMARFFGVDAPTSSARTRERFGWQPTQAGLLADIDRPSYF